MKKHIIELLIGIGAFFGFISPCFALTELQQTGVDNFLNNHFDSDYNYCFMYDYTSSSNHIFKFFCSQDDTTFKNDNSTSNIVKDDSKNAYVVDFRTSDNGNTFTRLHKDYYGSNISYSTTNGYPLTLCSYNLLNTDNSLYCSKNWTLNSLSYYTVTFVLPSGATLIVKDSNNEVITPESGSIYNLLEGTYTYSVSKNTYNSLTDVQLVVDEDKTITIELESSLNSAPYRSIYSQYYTYISQLVSNIFGLENPLFLYIVAFIIGFAIITLIKRLIGGR